MAEKYQSEQCCEELRTRIRELEELVRTDPLTGLLNRRAVADLVRQELQRGARYPRPLALGLIDVDHFKEINRRYLLPGGDQMLVHLAGMMTGCVRAVDKVGRIGGDEFLVLAPETNEEGAAVLAERLRSTVESGEAFYHGQGIRVTVSLGYVVAPAGVKTDFDTLLHAAAAALSEAKALGGNRWVPRDLGAAQK